MERIIKNADAAMYLAKERGRNNFQFYTMDPSDVLTRRYKLEYGLRRAIENKEFILYYQPQIDLMTNQLCGLEALIRWQHPEFGMIPPNEFIPLAEENGLIHEIGKWVIKQACHQNKKWQEAGLPHIAVAVNISTIQFRDPTFVSTVIEVVKESKLASEYLELEITESTVHSFTDTVEKLRTIKEHGIKISIDDFGTGYSSLSAIDNLPIDQIKIDRSFIINMISNSNKAAIVKTIIDLGHNLHFQIVAEGIEYTEQMDVLKEYKCHIGQGYLFSRPLTVEEVERLYIKTGTALQKEKMKRKSKET
jgi:EAL domain-containing protein (putative c-di-GMP-specific phosphodiesterase class I)